eukprot:SAG31_NODE_5378_length_2576_cov_1.025434_2_plen_155_part_00
MQDDGNLVIYHVEEDKGGAKAIWSSRTSGPIGQYYLTLNDDGNLGVFPGVCYSLVLPVLASLLSVLLLCSLSTSEPYVGKTNSSVLPTLLVCPLQSDGTPEGECFWKTRSKPQKGDYYMVLQDDGKLAIYRGTDPEHSAGLVRRMRPRYVPKKL